MGAGPRLHFFLVVWDSNFRIFEFRNAKNSYRELPQRTAPFQVGPRKVDTGQGRPWMSNGQYRSPIQLRLGNRSTNAPCALFMVQNIEHFRFFICSEYWAFLVVSQFTSKKYRLLDSQSPTVSLRRALQRCSDYGQKVEVLEYQHRIRIVDRTISC